MSKIIKYKITIQATEEYEATDRVVKSEKPTAIKKVKSAYGGGAEEEVQFDREYENRSFKSIRTSDVFEQEVSAEGFDLTAVIKAINGI